MLSENKNHSKYITWNYYFSNLKNNNQKLKKESTQSTLSLKTRLILEYLLTRIMIPQICNNVNQYMFSLKCL